MTMTVPTTRRRRPSVKPYRPPDAARMMPVTLIPHLDHAIEVRFKDADGQPVSSGEVVLIAIDSRRGPIVAEPVGEHMGDAKVLCAWAEVGSIVLA